MTHDFIDDFCDALDREKRAYVLIVQHRGAENKVGAHIRTDLDPWPAPANGKSKEYDMMLALAAAFRADAELLVLDWEQQNQILGALDTLGVLLAEKGHTWSEGERAIYEAATELLGKKSGPPEDE